MPKTHNHKFVWKTLPKGVFALFFIQIFSTLSFSVLYSTLVLYMTGPLALKAGLANSIMGVFVACCFALHLLGGFLGGRFFSYRALFCLGMIAQIIGCMILASEHLILLHYGLSAFLIGAGVNVTCINCLLTQRFQSNDLRRESAFLYNYAGMNIGFFAGYTLSGYFQLLDNYPRLFLSSCLGNLVAMFICLYCWRILEEKNTAYAEMDKTQQTFFCILGLSLCACLAVLLCMLLNYADFANRLVLLTGVVMLIMVFAMAISQPSKQAREKIFAFAILMIVGTIFWTLYQTGPMGITQFIAHNVKGNSLIRSIPPQWFHNINTFCIVIGGPLLSITFHRMRAKGVSVNIPIQFALGLLLIGCAFLVLPIGISWANTDGMVSPLWIVIGFTLQSAGELLVSPIGYAMIGALVPASLQGVMMGIWMLSSGVGATLSSYSSNWMTAGQASVDPLLTNQGYSHVFLMMGLMAVAVGICLFLLSPVIRRWMDEKDTAKEDDVHFVTVGRL